MTAPNPLLLLGERVEGAMGADRELDALIHCVREELEFVLLATGNEVYGDICDPGDSGYGGKNKVTGGLLYARYPDHKNPPTLGGGKRGNSVQGCSPDRYTASLDAALSLVPEGWILLLEQHSRCWTAGLSDKPWYDDLRVTTEGDAATPALAIAAAALKARAAIEASK